MKKRSDYRSWGCYPQARHKVIRLHDRYGLLPATAKPLLPYGNGRSYGDSCLNDGSILLHTRGLDRFIAFDPQTGVLRCEAGVLLAEILELVVPQGWFLPVTPGTKLVTIGGAVANDVHGKNHHRVGTFGCHLRCFELLRSDGSRLLCSAAHHPEWFAASIGGLGLTGLISWVEIQLKRIANPWIAMETLRFRNLDAFFELSTASDRDYEHTVAWLDCASRGASLGRGLFMRGNHAPALCSAHPPAPVPRFTVPFTLPFSLINGLSLKAFNNLYYHRQRRERSHAISHYERFFYPLDSINDWNRVYGRRGFLQYQCVVPQEQGHAAIREIVERIVCSGTGSFLAVLKVFGHVQSPGLLSFPRPGVTLALDFPNCGPATFTLLDSLDGVVGAAGGSVYPAKDARMKGECFRRYFPHWQTFAAYLDPRFSSSFWRRVME